MGDCIFCKIAASAIPSAKLYEDAHTFAFLDIHPVSPGHTLVIPKRHSNDLLAISAEDLAAVARTVKLLAPAIVAGVSSDGINIHMNNGEAAGQAVFHSHIHLIPRFEGDGLTHWHGKPYPEGKAEEVERKIREALD